MTRGGQVATFCMAALCIPTGCDSPTDVRRDSGACRQTYEFGNTGCADIQGTVVDGRGVAQAGIVVGPRYLPDRDGFNTVYATTNAEGRFRFRISRYWGNPPAVGPDTMSLFVYAADPRTAGVGVPAAVRDSVLGNITIAPIGSIPEPLEIAIQFEGQ
jgi:hypothetical protein